MPEASWWLLERRAACDGGVPPSRQPGSELGVIRNFFFGRKKETRLRRFHCLCAETSRVIPGKGEKLSILKESGNLGKKLREYTKKKKKISHLTCGVAG